MANIKVNSLVPLYHGQVITFRSPVDCSEVTGLVVSWMEHEEEASKTFKFADAHGNNVGDLDLFASDALVKVILDTEMKMAYVQNADTNAYLERRLAEIPTAAQVGAIESNITAVIDNDDIYAWADEQTVSKEFLVHASNTTTNIPSGDGLTDIWYKGLLLIGGNAKVMFLVGTAKKDEFYYTQKLNGTWQGWKEIFTTAGGTLSGNLGVHGGFGQLLATEKHIRISSNNTANNAQHYRYFMVKNSGDGTIAKNALELADIINGSATYYKIFGEHNPPTAEQVGAVHSKAVYYPASTGKLDTDLSDGLSLIALSSTLNAELWNALKDTFAYVMTLSYNDSRKMQTAWTYGGDAPRMAIRHLPSSGVWTRWTPLVTSDVPMHFGVNAKGGLTITY